jgi:hypothetical protein
MVKSPCLQDSGAELRWRGWPTQTVNHVNQRAYRSARMRVQHMTPAAAMSADCSAAARNGVMLRTRAICAPMVRSRGWNLITS